MVEVGGVFRVVGVPVPELSPIVDDLEAVCGGVYGRESLGGRSCLVTARGYYAAVVVAHPSHWRGHLNG